MSGIDSGTAGAGGTSDSWMSLGRHASAEGVAIAAAAIAAPIPATKRNFGATLSV
jgi:hypothetical protein